MRRSINDIQDVIVEAVAASGELNTLEVLTDNEQATLENLTSTSKVSTWRLFVWVVSFGIWVHEKLITVLYSDIEARIAATRPFTRQWYVSTSLNYQHGYTLPETGVYETPETSEALQAVNESKIIKKAAVVQQIISGVGALRIKIATLVGEDLVAVSAAQLQGFQQYIELIGAAGVFVVATTNEADDLKLQYDIHFNPLILDTEGKRLDGTNDVPVQTAIKDYLKSVNFNDQLDLVKLNNIIEAVDGVVSPFAITSASKYASFEYNTTGIPNAGLFTKFRQPDSGYFKLDEVNSVFNFITT